MAAVNICSDFGAPQNKVSQHFHCFPIYLPWSDTTRCHDLSFLNVEFLGSFFTLLFHLHQEASAPSHLLYQQRSILGCGTQGSDADLLCRLLSILPSTNQLLCSPPRLWMSLSIQSDPPPVKALPSVWDSFLIHSSLPGAQACPDSFPFLFPLSYLVMWRFSCPFGCLRSSAGIH